MSYTAQPISIIINQKFLTPPAISTLGTSRSAKMDSQFLRNLIFIPFTKVASAHPSITQFQIFRCHMIDETFSHPTYDNFPKMCHIMFYLAHYSKVSIFFETPGSRIIVSRIPKLSLIASIIHLDALTQLHAIL